MELTVELVALCQQVLAQQEELLAALRALLEAAPAAPGILQVDCTLHITSALTVFCQGLSLREAGDTLAQMAPPDAPAGAV